MKTITPAALLEKIRDLPPLPRSITQVLELTESTSSSAKDLTAVIEHDPTLAGKILKRANSAYYGFSRKISTLSHAIVCLGFNTVKSIALTVSTQDLLSNEIPAYELEKGMLWKHSICCAIGSRMIAQRIGYKDCEEAYIAGLLHDIGKIVLANFANEPFKQILEKTKDNKTPYNIAEKEVLGFDHSEIGAKIIDQWKLPSILVEAAQYHHQPEKAELNGTLTYIIHLADSICYMLGIGLGCDGIMYVLEPNTLNVLGLDQENVETLMSKLVDNVDNIENKEQE